MAEAETEEEEPKKKGSILPLLISVVVALLLGGGAFFVSYTGIFPPQSEPAVEAHAEDHGAPSKSHDDLPDVAFVQLDPILVTLAGEGASRYVRFGAQLEVPSAVEGDVSRLMPRILDMLNGYLRVLTLEDVQKPSALLTLRAHMLRRVELVVGKDRVYDLLVTEFVVN